MTHAELLEAVQQPRQRQMFLPLEFSWRDLKSIRWRLWGQHPFCFYCGREIGKRKKGTLDHIVPKSQGGRNTLDNLVLACSQCNTLKADRSLTEWVLSMLSAYLRIQEGIVVHAESEVSL